MPDPPGAGILLPRSNRIFPDGDFSDVPSRVELAELYRTGQVQSFGPRRSFEQIARHCVESSFCRARGVLPRRDFVPRPLPSVGTGRHRGALSLSELNLPGWRWGTIMQIPLVAVSRPLHSGVCETRQDAGLPVLHSKISDSGLLRTRGGQQTFKSLKICCRLCAVGVLAAFGSA